MAKESAAMNTPEETINAEYQGPKWVPDSLRELNKEAYTPQVISIGPLHHGSPKLESMENYKLRFFRNFMERTDINKEELASIIQDWEGSVRACYAEAIPFDSDTLKQIILLDAIFIIEFFLGISNPSPHFRVIQELNPSRLQQITLDLTLLENQLPFFIIEKLYELLILSSPPTLTSPPTYPSKFLELALKSYFMEWNMQNIPDIPDDGTDSEEFMQFLGENVQKIRDDYMMKAKEVMHLLDLRRYAYLCPLRTLPKRSFEEVHKMYCASQLAEAGLKFNPTSSRSIADLKFNEGVLQIPTFTLGRDTEICARNLVALEHCLYPFERYVTDYFIMLDFLINTGKDLDLLIDEKIIEKAGRGGNIIPNFCTGISWRELNGNYYNLCTQLEDFRKKHWYVILKSSLKRDYFRTTWMGAATVGAIILLILTLIQTIFTVISVFK
ncbi:hypothetical protein I3760_16G096500 [Carya illinoinensis]|nr:hypothetical protein I3760_16G096500 [Carya illinoinensis]KAG2664711.1 hypothetical protein I3760_16G096500 [Carya illinoinensis]